MLVWHLSSRCKFNQADTRYTSNVVDVIYINMGVSPFKAYLSRMGVVTMVLHGLVLTTM